MKLEFEKIVGHLPYGLKMNLNRNNGMFKADNVKIDNCQINKNNSIYGWYLTYKNVTYGLHDIKPILHPLSDLTKEIEIDGKKFVPIDVFFLELGGGYFSKNGFIKDFVANILLSLIDTIAYGIVKKLYEWHFDIHNLIENDLAIDINKL